MDYGSKWGKRNWKGIQADYDAVIINPVNTDGCCYCLEQNQVELLLAALAVYHWTTRWTNGDIDQTVIDDFVTRLEKTLMTGCGCPGQTDDGSAPEYRYELVNNEFVYQVSYDNGETWVTSPDYPIALAPNMPPPVGDTADTPCDAAVNGMEHIRDLVAAHTAAYDVATTAIEFVVLLATSLLALIFAPAAVPFLIPILIGVATAAFGIGKTAWEAYWTTEVYDIIQCALFCNMDENGQFDDAGYAGFMEDIGTQLPAGVPRDMLYRDMQTWGKKGVNTVCYGGIVQSGSDCSGCACEGCDFSTWVVANGTLVSQDATHITVTAELIGSSYLVTVRSAHIDTCCCGVAYERSGGGALATIGYNVCGSAWYENVGFAYTGQAANAMLYGDPAPYTVTLTSTEPCEE